jgi:phage-related protein
MAVFQSTGDSSGELSDVLNFLGDVWGLLRDIIKLNVDLILAIVVPAFKMIAGFINDHGTEIKAILTAVWTVIKTVITTTLTVIKGVITAVMQLIKGDWSGAWDTIKGVLSTVWSAMKTIIDANITVIKNLLSGAWESIKGGVTSAWDGIKSAVAKAWDSIKGAISDKIGELKGVLQKLPEQANGIGERIISTIWDGLRSQWDSVMRWLNDKLRAAREIWSSITGGGGDGETQGNAVGTKSFRGGMTMVGEFGPELVSLPRGSAIHTNSDSRAMMGGDTYVFNFADSVSSYDRSRLESDTRQAMSNVGNKAFNRMRTGG